MLNPTGLSEGIRGLRHLVGEWESIVARPYRDVSRLDSCLRAAVRVEHAEEEAEWMQHHI